MSTTFASQARRSPSHGVARARTRRSPAAGFGTRVRWDRVGRLALLCVLVSLLYLYLSAGVRLFSTYRQAHADKASVAALSREHAQLELRRAALGRQATVEAQARGLGMAHRGELQYVLTGLPAD